MFEIMQTYEFDTCVRSIHMDKNSILVVHNVLHSSNRQVGSTQPHYIDHLSNHGDTSMFLYQHSCHEGILLQYIYLHTAGIKDNNCNNGLPPVFELLSNLPCSHLWPSYAKGQAQCPGETHSPPF